MKDADSVMLRNVEDEAREVVDKLERALKAHESPKKTPDVMNMMINAKTLVNKLKHNLNVRITHTLRWTCSVRCSSSTMESRSSCC